MSGDIIRYVLHANPEPVFLDTQVFVASGFNFRSKAIQSLKTHLKLHRLRLVLTDLTIREVKRQVARQVTHELKLCKPTRTAARVLRSSTLPNVQAALTLDAEAITHELCQQLDSFLKEAEVEIISIEDVKATSVFERYFDSLPPFGPKDEKVCEFPDAFAIEALHLWAQKTGQRPWVVSGDKLFRQACNFYSHLRPLERLEDLLDHIASENEQVAELIRAALDRHSDKIVLHAAELFEQLEFWDSEDGEAEVMSPELRKVGTAKVIYAGLDECTAQITFKAAFEAHVSFLDVSALCEDEDGRMMFPRREDNVWCEEDVVVEVDATFQGTPLHDFTIWRMKLVEPARGLRIITNASPYEWPK